MATSTGSNSPDDLVEEAIDSILDDSYPLEPVEEDCGGCGIVTGHDVYLPSFDVSSERHNPRRFTYRLTVCNDCGESSYDQVRDL